MGIFEGDPCILLHQQNRRPLLIDLLQDAEELIHQKRSKSHGGLVQEHHSSTGHHGTGHGEHLLLPATQGIRALMAALLQPREETEDPPRFPLNLLMIFVGIGCNLQILPDRQISEDPSPLRDQGDPEAAHDVVRGKPREISALQKSSFLSDRPEPQEEGGA